MTTAEPAARCPSCEAPDAKETMAVEAFAYGAGQGFVTLTVTVPEISCKRCRLVFTDERAEAIRTEAIRRHLASLKP